MNNINQQVKDLIKQPIILGNELGKGGEGTVFAIKNSPNLVVKIYHQTPSQDKTEKILAMVRLGTERLLNLSTWPLASYYSDKGVLSGFIMPRLTNHYPLYELYNPKLRLEKFPKADWRFLIHAAMNVARAFAVIHGEGHVIGDVNHGNLVVAEDSTVRFIDIDSFQVIDNKKCWFCEVGVSTHQPPEMQQLSTFSAILRTPNHDNFGLAVLIFQLLFLARHPFSGRFHGPGEMPLEKAIAEYRFAFSSNQQALQMCPPPSSLPMAALTSHLRLLFERAFSKDSVGPKVGLRPTPDEWLMALMALSASLERCSLRGGHYYYKELKGCPWCDIETESGLLLFPVFNLESSPRYNIATIWQQVLSIKDPGPEPPPPPLIFQSCRPSLKAKVIIDELKPLQIYCFGIWCVILLMTIGLGNLGSAWLILGLLGTIFFPFGAIYFYEKRKKQLSQDLITELDTIKKKWEHLMTCWKIPSSNTSFGKIRQNIDKLKGEYNVIGTGRDKLLQKSFKDQMRIHLNSFHIANSNIEGIGTERIATLKSHGFETAADIEEHRLQGIKGIGNVFRKRLIKWRQQMESNFIFNSNKDLNTQEITSIDKEIAQKRQQIAASLANAASQLHSFTEQIHKRRRQLSLETAQILSKYSQAVADARTIGLEF